MAGVLYVVATPIGNLGDLTLRAIETLRSVDRIVAEDTRRTRTLLTHLEIEKKPLSSLEAHATARDVERVVGWLRVGEHVALVTDAGVPAVSDPGSALVQAAIGEGIRVVPIPGASALTAAVAAAGIVSDGFRFFGFLPRAGSARADVLAVVLATPEAVVLFESPQRLAATLTELAGLCPDRSLVVAREMTKIHEEFIRGTVAEVAAHEREWLGEATLVLGPDSAAGSHAPVGDAEIDERIDQELARGESSKNAAQRISAWAGRSRKEIYQRIIVRRGGD